MTHKITKQMLRRAIALDACREQLWADYKAKNAALLADYEAKRVLLWADYEAKCAALFGRLAEESIAGLRISFGKG